MGWSPTGPNVARTPPDGNPHDLGLARNLRQRWLIEDLSS